MGYQSRKRGYKSRREKFQQSTRHLRIVTFFGLLGMSVWLFMNRYEIWAWLKTYIYG